MQVVFTRKRGSLGLALEKAWLVRKAKGAGFAAALVTTVSLADCHEGIRAALESLEMACKAATKLQEKAVSQSATGTPCLVRLAFIPSVHALVFGLQLLNSQVPPAAVPASERQRGFEYRWQQLQHGLQSESC